MKRWIVLIVVCAVIGSSGAGAYYLFATSRWNRDNMIYTQGRVDGRNTCGKETAGIYLPNGVTKGDSLEALMDSRYSGT